VKVIVLGASGMAGHVIATHLADNGYAVETLSAKNKLNDRTILLDVTDTVKLKSFLEANHYDIVINCIGLLVEKSEHHKDLATYLNAYLPHFLETYYKGTDTKIIHLSTDCVFSGKNAPYEENSAYDGELFYDRSKALGEIINDKDLTFRMSIVGPDMQEDGIGLFNWFYRQTGPIDGYTGAVWSGVTTIELAKAIKSAIEQDLSGLYHLVPNKNITKYDLLLLFSKIFNRVDIKVRPSSREVTDKTLINTRNDFKYLVPDYKTMVKEMKTWVNEHNNLYQHYER